MTFKTKLFVSATGGGILALAAAAAVFAAFTNGGAERTALVAAVAAGVVVATAWAAGFTAAVGRRLDRRVRAIGHLARRYREGDFTPAVIDYGDDEIGRAARELDGSVQELGERLVELARDRARMAAVLAGMIEGVIVVDPKGRVQLLNEAARQMLKIDDLAIRRHYVETIRHPAITDLVGAALGGQPVRLGAALSAARRDADDHGQSGADRQRPAATARFWCSTTSPNCGARIRSAATSSPTCRTSCARLSRRSAAISRR